MGKVRNINLSPATVNSNLLLWLPLPCFLLFVFPHKGCTEEQRYTRSFRGHSAGKGYVNISSGASLCSDGGNTQCCTTSGRDLDVDVAVYGKGLGHLLCPSTAFYAGNIVARTDLLGVRRWSQFDNQPLRYAHKFSMGPRQQTTQQRRNVHPML